MLKELRLQLGLSQQQVAKGCGIAQGYYSQLENGTRMPSVKTAKKIAEFFKVDWAKFFT